MRLTSQNSTQNLFFKSDKKREFTDVLNEVQSYISSKYSMLVIDGINNVNSGDDNIKQQVKRYIGKYLLDYRISVEGLTQTELVDKLYTEMAEFSFLTKYIFGTGIEEININSWDDIEVQYSNGTNVKIDEHFESPEHAINVVRRMLHVSGMVLDNTSPAILGHLSKNIRIAVLKTPLVDEDVGVAASIRIVNAQKLKKEDFLKSGTATDEMMELLSALVRYGVSTTVAGATSSGKTTLTGWLLTTIPYDKRILTIESGSRELDLVVRDSKGKILNKVVHTITRESEDDKKSVSQDDLLDMALRFHPDYIVVGEMRSSEADSAQEAARTGHTVITTIHSNSCESTWRRMVTLCKRKYPNVDDKGEAVYLLYPDNTEGMAESRDEIENFSGYFGIEKEPKTVLERDNELTPVSKSVALEMWDKNSDVFIDGIPADSRKDIANAPDTAKFAVLEYQYSAELDFDRTNGGNTMARNYDNGYGQQNYGQSAPINPNVIGNTPYNQLGGRGQLQFYTDLKNRHADNIANQLNADGVRFSGLRKGEVTTITINKADIPRYEAAVEKVKQSYRQNGAPQYQQNVPNQNYQQNFQQPTNPNVIGNTPYNQLGGKGELQFYTNLKNRHADNVAKQLDEDGVRFSGLRKGTVTTITINKADIPRYEAALAKVKQMYDKLNNRSAQVPETAFREQMPKPKPTEPPRTDFPEMSKDEPSSFKTVPICTQSLMEAKQSGNLGAWKDSIAASKACIKFIEDNLSVAYEGRDPEGFVKQLNDKFGIDRAMYSVAATIQLKDHDGRFTNAVKNRAAQFGFDSDNMRLNFLMERHPVMINHLYQQMMEMEQELRLNAPEQDKNLSAVFDGKFLYSSERVELRDDFRGIPETKYYKSSANEFFIPEIGWLDNAAYNRELKSSELTAKDFYATVTRVNANYIDGTGMTGQMDMSRAEYDSMLEKTYAPENAEALKSALGKLDERRNAANIPEKPTEYYAVRQVSERRYAVCSISADGLVTTAKPNITSISEAKKAMLEIFEQKKGSAKVEFVHPQTLDEISAKMYNERAQEELPDIMYRINLNSDKKSADTHVLQEYVKNDEGKYSVGQEVVKGDYEKCNKFLAQLMSAPKIEPPAQTFEIYQLKSGDETHDIRFQPYEDITKAGKKPDFANYEKVYEGNAADLSGNLGEKLESLFEKFNLDRPEDFKGHSLSVSDIVVLEDKAYYIDDVGFKPLEDFIPLEVKQSRFYDELPKRLSDIAEGKVSPLQDNLLKVGNDALRLNVPPYIMREAAFRNDDERVQKLADTYEKMCERNGSCDRESQEQDKPHRKSRL